MATTEVNSCKTIKQLQDVMQECFKNIEGKIENENKKISDDINEMRSVIINNLLEANKKLQFKVEQLEKELEHQKTNLEINNQYNRRNNIEISGIPNNVKDEELEGKVLTILNKIEVNVKEEDIEACHRLPLTRSNNVKRTVIKFINRKKSENCIKSKKKLSDLNMGDVGFPDGTTLYLSENLNPFFQKLTWQCRKLKRQKIIESYKYQNEAVFVKVSQDSKPKKFVNERQLFETFPGFFYNELVNN